MHTILDIALIFMVGFSVISNFMGLPGNILIALSGLLYGISTGFEAYSFTFVLTLFAVLIFFEVLEFILIYVAAKKFGCSRWGIAGGIVGGILGALSGMLYSPVLGALIGSVIGVFIGASGLELFRSGNLKSSLFAGLGAFLGRIGGLSVKVVGAMTMSIMIVQKII